MGAKQQSQPFAVRPANWPAVTLFMAAQTQWRYANMDGVPTGLDYAGVEASMRMMHVRPSRKLFERLRIMEATILGIWAKKRE